MKQTLAAIMAAVLLAPAPAIAAYSLPGGVEQQKCFKRIYREKYVPGTRKNPGYVHSWTEKVEVPCYSGPSRPVPDSVRRPAPQADDNSCIEGSVLGGILGAGAGAALSRNDGRLWAIPLGIVGGSLVGCQVDGG